MKPQNVRGEVVMGKLSMSWEAPINYMAVSIQVAQDTNMVIGRQTFVVPAKTVSLALDLGAGIWYFRVGGWRGSAQRGTIDWSGTYGPFRMEGVIKQSPSFTTKVEVHYTQAIANGIRLHTGLYEPYYIIVDYTRLGTLNANTATSVYHRDENRGYVDILDLQPENTYLVRISGFSKGIGNLPENSIKYVADGPLMSGKRPARVGAINSNTDRAATVRDKAILREESEGRRGKFSSYAEYTQYVAAKARTEERRTRV